MDLEAINNNTSEISFWSGNRSSARQVYEREVIDAALKITAATWGDFRVNESTEEYPGFEEAKAFDEKGHDVLVTVGGNQKFKDIDKIVVPIPIMKNLLGYRIPIIRNEDRLAFKNNVDKNSLPSLAHGIPETWSDAAILRHNTFNVIEEGSFETLFQRLANKQFDYTTFGANEVISILEENPAFHGSLILEKNVALHYPLPLLFYVHPKHALLAKRLEEGLVTISTNGDLDRLFNNHYSSVITKLQLNSRKHFSLKNPFLPKELEALIPAFGKF